MWCENAEMHVASSIVGMQGQREGNCHNHDVSDRKCYDTYEEVEHEASNEPAHHRTYAQSDRHPQDSRL